MAKSNRIKLAAPLIDVPKDRTAAESLAGKITTLKLKEAMLAAQLDGHIKDVRSNYEGHFAVIKDDITPMVDALHAWAEAHPEEFNGKKSTDLLHAIVGWRTNPPSLKPLKGFTWAAVLERIKNLGRIDFIRTKEELNKEAILANRDEENLKSIYVQVLQEDEFFVDPKITTPDSRETA